MSDLNPTRTIRLYVTLDVPAVSNLNLTNPASEDVVDDLIHLLIMADSVFVSVLR